MTTTDRHSKILDSLKETWCNIFMRQKSVASEYWKILTNENDASEKNLLNVSKQQNDE